MKSIRTKGMKIKEKREVLGWTQEKLASKSGYSSRTIRKAEAGRKLSVQTLIDISEALEIDLFEIIGSSDFDRIATRNRHIVEKAIDAICQENIGVFMSTLTDDVTVYLSGPKGSVFSGIFNDKSEVRNLISKSRGALIWDMLPVFQRWIVSGDCVVVWGTLAQRKDSPQSHQLGGWCINFRLEEGLIREIRHYSDNSSLNGTAI